MDVRAHPQPPSESGRLDGIAWCLWLPPGEGPWPAVMVLHGAGSRKENHADYARAAVAHGFAALTFDNRGHGETEGTLGRRRDRRPRRCWRQWLAARPEVDGGRIGVRGSSMGGLLAIHAGSRRDDIAAAVAICPAAEWMLAEDVQRVLDGRPPPAGQRPVGDADRRARAGRVAGPQRRRGRGASGWAPSRCC